MAGTLFLLPNSLGLPDDSTDGFLATIIPTQVLAITARLDYFIAENAKTTRAYLKQVAHHTPLGRPLQEIRIAELNKHSAKDGLMQLLEPIIHGADAGLISEAGLPAIADPGADLVRLAHEKEVRVAPLVGPSSLLMALMASGLNGQSFAFVGYLPTDFAERAKRIRFLEERSRVESQTQLLIETPYRNVHMLEALATHLRADTLVSIATDLSLPNQSIATKTAGQWRLEFNKGKLPDFQKRPTVFLFLAER